MTFLKCKTLELLFGLYKERDWSNGGRHSLD